jgi:type IV secretory pathway TrbD component
MTKYNFADIYRSAQISLEPATMALRQKAAEQFLKGRSFDDCVGLAKLHLGLPAPEFRDRLVEVFRTEDGTFSIMGNDRELTVLSTGLVAAIVIDGDLATALALVSGSFAGTRVAQICPELAEWAKAQLIELAVRERNRNLESSLQVPKPGPSKIPAQIDAWIPQPQDLPKLAPILKEMCQETEAFIGIGTDRANKNAALLVNELRGLREELEMLWWNVGGYSTQLSTPFSELSKALVPVLAGIELAGMTQGKGGPAAIGALIQLKLKACKVAASAKIVDTVNAAVKASVVAPNLPEGDPLAELCPLLTAVKLRQSVGDSVAWTEAFKTQTGIDATTEMSTLDLAMQVYREMLLVKCRV